MCVYVLRTVKIYVLANFKYEYIMTVQYSKIRSPVCNHLGSEIFFPLADQHLHIFERYLRSPASAGKVKFLFIIVKGKTLLGEY